MLSKCANPACSKPFRYLRNGKLFEIETKDRSDPAVPGRAQNRRVEFFWLCDLCSTGLTLINDKDRGVIPIPSDRAENGRRAKFVAVR